MPTFGLKEFNTFDKKLVIGVGAMEVSNAQNTVLTTYSLGSCLGVAIFDPVARAGGLLHAMLPDSSINPERANERPAMFVDTGIAALFRATYKLGADKHRIRICVAGASQFMDDSGFFNIGQRNVKQLAEILRRHGLTVAAQEVGGYVCRTLQLNITTGEVHLRTSGQNTETILYKS
jgi:chemotaxis protein CheD